MRLFWLLLLSGGATSLASNSINLLPSGTLARSGTGTVALGTATSSGGTAPSAVPRTHTTLGPSAGKTSARLSWNGPFGNSTATQSGTAGSVLPSGSSGTTLAKTSGVNISGGVTSVNSVSETVISNTGGVITLATSITTPFTTTLPDGDTTTIGFVTTLNSGNDVTLLNSASETVISNTDGVFTLPTGITTPLATTLPDGKSMTSRFTTTSTTTPVGFLFPVTTPVPSPKPTHGGTVIPCSLWFFVTCLRWDDLNIFGWVLDLPEGKRPPGPPPPFKIDPSASFSIHVSGTLPKWPEITIGPDHLPTYLPKPSDGPDGDCEVKTAELCATKTSFGVSTSGQATVTTTTQVLSTCTTVSGCNVEDASRTSSTTAGCTVATGTASGSTCSTPSSTYVVYPRDGTDDLQVSSIAARLQKYVDDASSIQPSNTKTLGLNYWLLPLNQSSAEEIRALPDVTSVYAECSNSCWQGPSCPDGCYDPSIELVYQTKAPDQLSYVAWPPTVSSELWWLSIGSPELSGGQQYYFDDSGGEHVPLYVYDTGATMSHSEFDLIRDRVRWIHAGTDPNGQQPEDDHPNDRLQYHGTAMLSLAAGKTLGVAKNIDPIIVRMPRGAFSQDRYLDGLGKINDDLGTQPQSEAKATVLLAHYYPLDVLPSDEYQAWVNRFQTILTAMASKGAIIVTGSGNVRRGEGVINGWPANFGKSTGPVTIPSLIVAGALSPRGQETIYASDPQGGVPQIYAPGINVKVAEGNPNLGDSTRNSIGTSDATAMTTGLAAYYLRLIQLGRLKDDAGSLVPNSPQSIKDYIIHKGWSRQQVFGEDRKGIWNGVDLSQPVCPWVYNPPTRIRREETMGSCLVPLSSSTVSSSSTVVSNTVTSSAIPTLSTTFTSISTSPSSPPSSSTVTQPPPAPTPTAPLEVQSVVCNNEADYPGHADIYGDTVIYLADKACNSWKSSDDAVLSAAGGQLSVTEKNADNVQYTYSVTWSIGCITTVSSMNVYSPLGDAGPTCPDIMHDTYKDCTTNGGVGGYIDVGCLRYQFIGGAS